MRASHLLAALWILAELLWAAYMHNKPREPRPFWAALIAYGVVALMLWCGGFWR